MKISSLRQQIKNPGRVSVFVGNKYSFSLSLDELVKYKLKNGDQLTAADIKKFKKISADGKLRARALEWLLNRPHSVKEFRDYLYRKKVDELLGKSLTTEFTERGYLDDFKFAQWFAELQLRRGRSNRAIASEFFKKGIDREITDNILESEADSELDRLKQIVAKKELIPRYKNDKQKLAKYLISQGFNFSAIKEVLEIDYFN